jgi:aminoglycoside phosphotransferase (APT) family kinase protein
MSADVDPRARVATAFPELDASEVRQIGTGWTVDTYEVDDGWIVQFPRDARAADRLRAQIETLPELAAELPALVPEPTHIDHDGPAIAYRKIDGVPLDEAPDGLWPERLGRLLYDLHLMPAEYVGLRGGTAADVRDAMRRELNDFRARVLPLLEPDEAAHIGSRFAAFVDDDDLWRFAPCLTHRDLGPEHVLVSPSGDLAGVLDWEELGVDDPVADFAWLLHEMPEQGERALSAYGGAPDPAFRTRGAVRYALMPFHEVRYGLDTRQEAYVASGLEGVRRRARWLETSG